MDHDDGFFEVQGHDLQFDAAVVIADPDQSRIRCRSGIDMLGLDGVDHVHRMGLANPVASGGAIPPKFSVHTVIVAQNSLQGCLVSHPPAVRPDAIVAMKEPASSAGADHGPTGSTTPTPPTARSARILRAAASAARIAELNAGDDHAVGEMKIEQARQRATPVLIDVLSRYPEVRAINNRVAQLMSTLDTALRAPR